MKKASISAFLALGFFLTSVLVTEARVTEFNRTLTSTDGTEWHIEGCVSWSIGLSGVSIDAWEFTATNKDTGESHHFVGGGGCNGSLSMSKDYQDEDCEELRQECLQIPCPSGMDPDDCQFVLDNVCQWVYEDCMNS